MHRPSPSVIGSPSTLPSGDTIMVMQPPRRAFCWAGSSVIDSIWWSSSQPVALTTKQPDSAAWWRIAASIWSANTWPTMEPGNWAQWISSCWVISA